MPGNLTHLTLRTAEEHRDLMRILNQRIREDPRVVEELNRIAGLSSISWMSDIETRLAMLEDQFDARHS